MEEELIVKLALGQKVTDKQIVCAELSNNEIPFKLGKGEKISDSDIANELYEICDREHAGCNNACPVFRLNGSEVVKPKKGYPYGCACFKSGSEMLKFIRKKFKE